MENEASFDQTVADSVDPRKLNSGTKSIFKTGLLSLVESDSFVFLLVHLGRSEYRNQTTMVVEAVCLWWEQTTRHTLQV